MAVKIRAHYDGKTFVPDEPVDLKVGEPVEVTPAERLEEADDFERRLAMLNKVADQGVRGTNIPLEALRRENLYEDRS